MEGQLMASSMASLALSRPPVSSTNLICSPRLASCSSSRVFQLWKERTSRLDVSVRAVEDVVEGVLVLGVVGAAAFALSKVQKQQAEQTREDCETCKGTGLCSACDGQGFVMKELSPEVAARAKQNAKAANRNTAGLPNKWKYCLTCSGSRACLDCQGRGWNSAEKVAS